MHPLATLATAHQAELIRRASTRGAGSDLAATRSRHLFGRAIGRYFARGAQADQQPLRGSEFGASGVGAGSGSSLQPAACAAPARR